MRVVMTNHGPDYERAKWVCLASTIIKMGESWESFFRRVIVISDAIRRNIASRWPHTPLYILYTMVSLSTEICSDDAYLELGIKPGRHILGMSRFEPEKNLHHLIDAFNRTGLARYGYKLVLAGDVDFEDD